MTFVAKSREVAEAMKDALTGIVALFKLSGSEAFHHFARDVELVRHENVTDCIIGASPRT